MKVGFEDAFSGQGGKIEGVLVGDKVGDIYFINLRNLPKLGAANQQDE